MWCMQLFASHTPVTCHDGCTVGHGRFLNSPTNPAPKLPRYINAGGGGAERELAGLHMAPLD